MRDGRKVRDKDGATSVGHTSPRDPGSKENAKRAKEKGAQNTKNQSQRQTMTKEQGGSACETRLVTLFRGSFD